MITNTTNKLQYGCPNTFWVPAIKFDIFKDLMSSKSIVALRKDFKGEQGEEFFPGSPGLQTLVCRELTFFADLTTVL